MDPMSWDKWARTIEVEPSLYAGDFARLGEQLDSLLAAGVRVIHFDVGDGHFVPPVTIGPVVLRSISPLLRAGGAVVDCHLMVDHPEHHFAELRDSGADSVTVHHEVCADRLADVVAAARALGLAAGLAFNPETDPEQAADAAREAGVALVLCMSIHPGYSGQKLMPEAFARVRRLRALLPPGVHVQVDGGVGEENIRQLREAGASLFVCGTSIFGRPDPGAAYEALTRLVQ
jgi:ribulose-phosphate 3-epimerase